MREAERDAGGNQDDFLHNLTTSLGIVCGLLCAFSAYGVATHRVTIMSQVGESMAYSDAECLVDSLSLHVLRQTGKCATSEVVH